MHGTSLNTFGYVPLVVSLWSITASSSSTCVVNTASVPSVPGPGSSLVQLLPGSLYLISSPTIKTGACQAGVVVDVTGYGNECGLLLPPIGLQDVLSGAPTQSLSTLGHSQWHP